MITSIIAMETITNVVNTVSGTVSKAIYGEQPANGNETAGNEPVSGVQGQGTATDPYDKGNSGTSWHISVYVSED